MTHTSEAAESSARDICGELSEEDTAEKEAAESSARDICGEAIQSVVLAICSNIANQFSSGSKIFYFVFFVVSLINK